MRLVVARCSVQYSGRLDATLPEAVRLIMVKADGCVAIHSDGGAYKPLNWMTAPNTVVELEGQWIVTNPKGETLTINLHEVFTDKAHEFGEDPGLQKDGVEAHLQELLAALPDTIESGLTFDEFVKRRIFEPLGMNDTWWNVPEEYQDRLIDIVGSDIATPPNSAIYDTSHSTYFGASYGLKSTAGDYLRFEQMLVNGGELFGNRLLKPQTIELMASNKVGNLFNAMPGVSEQGFGYTVATTEESNERRSKGAFGWGGALGTRSWSDPAEELTGVIMIQQPVPAVQRDFEDAVHQALID